MKKSNLEMMLKGIELVREAIVAELGNENVTDAKVVNIEDVKEDKKETKKAKKQEKMLTEEEVAEAQENMEVESNDLAEELNGMSLKELKEKAKELGVAIRGSKSAIIGRILEALDNAEDEEEVIEEEVIETDDEIEEDETVGDEVETVDLEEALKDYTLEELAEMLTEAGISPKGKKQALIAKVIKAVEEGKIEFDMEDDEDVEDESDDVVEDDETTEDAEVDAEDIELEDILEEVALKDIKAICKELGIKVALKDKKPALIEKLDNFEDSDALIQLLIDKGIIEATDDVEDDDESEEVEIEGSEERQEAVLAMRESIIEDIENGEIEVDDIREFFNDLYEGNKPELKKLSKMDDEEIAELYVDMVSECIDDDAEEVEFNTPYMVGDKPYCCGRPMKHVEGTTYVCVVDGEETELEEE